MIRRATRCQSLVASLLANPADECQVPKATASIERAHTALTDRIGALDTTSVPDWHREAFTEQLDRIAEERQDTLRSHQSCSRLDAHSLCGYLYKREPWTYPVLTAVGRLREALVL